jgi:hypothetical protein
MNTYSRHVGYLFSMSSTAAMSREMNSRQIIDGIGLTAWYTLSNNPLRLWHTARPKTPNSSC